MQDDVNVCGEGHKEKQQGWMQRGVEARTVEAGTNEEY